jgi:hypothetical protein
MLRRRFSFVHYVTDADTAAVVATFGAAIFFNMRARLVVSSLGGGDGGIASSSTKGQ